MKKKRSFCGAKRNWKKNRAKKSRRFNFDRRLYDSGLVSTKSEHPGELFFIVSEKKAEEISWGPV